MMIGLRRSGQTVHRTRPEHDSSLLPAAGRMRAGSLSDLDSCEELVGPVRNGLLTGIE